VLFAGGNGNVSGLTKFNSNSNKKNNYDELVVPTASDPVSALSSRAATPVSAAAVPTNNNQTAPSSSNANATNATPAWMKYKDDEGIQVSQQGEYEEVSSLPSKSRPISPVVHPKFEEEDDYNDEDGNENANEDTTAVAPPSQQQYEPTIETEDPSKPALPPQSRTKGGLFSSLGRKK